MVCVNVQVCLLKWALFHAYGGHCGYLGPAKVGTSAGTPSNYGRIFSLVLSLVLGAVSTFFPTTPSIMVQTEQLLHEEMRKNSEINNAQLLGLIWIWFGWDGTRSCLWIACIKIFNLTKTNPQNQPPPRHMGPHVNHHHPPPATPQLPSAGRVFPQGICIC